MSPEAKLLLLELLKLRKQENQAWLEAIKQDQEHPAEPFQNNINHEMTLLAELEEEFK